MKPFLTSVLPSVRTDSRVRYRDLFRSSTTSVVVPLTVALQPARFAEIILMPRMVPGNSVMPLWLNDATSSDDGLKRMC